jgi:hypothetical protein
MIETYIQLVISYKKEIIYLLFFLLGAFVCKLNYLDCSRNSICQEDIKSKKKAFKMMSSQKEEHLKELRKQEDLHYLKCKSKITEALKQKKSASNELDCLICSNLMLQCK